MTNDTFYTAIDLGTSKVTSIIARIGESGDLKIVGAGVVPSQGIYQGKVEDLRGAKEAVHASMEEARRYLGRHRAKWAYASISGDHIACLNTEGQIHGSKDNGAVTPSDLHRLIESSYPDVSHEAEVLHVIPMEYEVDGFKGVRNPIGLHADNLRVESHIVLSKTGAVRSLMDLVKSCGVSARSLVASSLAAAEAVLSEDEKEMGVVLIDMGAGTVDLAIFRNGNPWYSGVIPLGGVHMTRDLSAALEVPFYQAEELKVKWGHALPEAVSAEREVMLPGPRGAPPRLASQQSLCEPLWARLEEIVGMVVLRVRQAGLKQLPSAGLVVTGGCAEMPGFADKVRSMVGAPVRVAYVEGISGLPSALSKPPYAAAVGTLLWGIKHQGRRRPYTNGHRSFGNYRSLFRRRSQNGHAVETAVPLARRRQE